MDGVSSTSCLASFLEKLSDQNSRIILGDFIIINLASHYQDALTWKIEAIKKAIPSRQVLSFTYYFRKGEGKPPGI